MNFSYALFVKFFYSLSFCERRSGGFKQRGPCAAGGQVTVLRLGGNRLSTGWLQVQGIVIDAWSANLCSRCSSFLCFVSYFCSFVICYSFYFFFSPAYGLVEVTAEVMVRRRHRLVGTGSTTVGECTDTSHHCIDIGAVLTPEHWHVRSVFQFLNSPSTLLLLQKSRRPKTVKNFKICP